MKERPISYELFGVEMCSLHTETHCIPFLLWETQPLNVRVMGRFGSPHQMVPQVQHFTFPHRNEWQPFMYMKLNNDLETPLPGLGGRQYLPPQSMIT